MAGRRARIGVAALALLVSAATAQADEPGREGQIPSPRRALNFENIAEWLSGWYSDAELRALGPDAFDLESRQCSCYDQPIRHYPYLVVVLTTPKGDLILRPDQRELQVSFAKLALRQGDLYCGVEPGAHCLGRFADVCDFTDFRYGPDLAPYIPTCKSADD